MGTFCADGLDDSSACATSSVITDRPGHGGPETLEEPFARQMRDLVQGAGLFEEMRRAGYDRHANVRAHLIASELVQFDHRLVPFANDEERRCLDEWQRCAREIGAAAA